MSTATILVVEDEQDVRDLLADGLRREGFEVLTSHSGREGLALAQGRLPDVILLDLMLGDMDGIEVCRELKGQSPTRSIPVIMVSMRPWARERAAGPSAWRTPRAPV